MRGSVFALCLAVSGPVPALEVIHDGGGEPIGPYLMRLGATGRPTRFEASTRLSAS